MATLLAVGLLSLHVSAAPARRDDPTALTSGTISEFTTGAIAQYLESKHADGLPFNVNGPWSSVDFAGSIATTTTAGDINKMIFNSVDTQKDRRTNTTINFSRKYVDFVQDVGIHVPQSQPTQKMNDTQAKMKDACYGDAMSDALSDALKAYNKFSHKEPTTNQTDPKFLLFADTAYPDYIAAHKACIQAQLAFQAAQSEGSGDDFGIYAAASAFIAPLILDTEAAPGVNMPISDVSETGAGNYLPYYSIPALNATLSNWQAGIGLEPFTFTSKSYTVDHSSNTKFGGAHLGVTYEGISADVAAEHSETHSADDTSAKDFELSFAGMALMSIDQGLWFDQYKFARVVQSPTDSNHQAAKDVFSNQSYFGSADEPGPLSVFNNMALVGFKPSWNITLDKTHQTDSESKTSFSFEGGIKGLVTVGGYGGCSNNNTHYDSTTNTVTISDDSNNGYIIGFVQTPLYS
ncbi:hypothetical protein C8R43DRAFT_1243503 [Mycena crocata]|nr:hypothetical protein C8R43DRAFT_1243503 [Mycena crocata]